MSKRQLPPWLHGLLEWDKKITKAAFDGFNAHFGYEKYRSHMKALELSCHGLIWLAGCIAMLYFGFNATCWVNMLVLQVLDIVLIAVIKAFVRRRRPALCVDDMFFTKGPDKFSFPSGHASRGFAVAFFFLYLYPVGVFLNLPIVIWAVMTAISRVCLARHHILDVVGGLVLALVEYGLMSVLWLSDESSVKWAGFLYDVEDPWSSG